MDKLQHAQRQEAAQQRREDKIRARKEKNMLLSETDPEKARKLEVRCCVAYSLVIRCISPIRVYPFLASD